MPGRGTVAIALHTHLPYVLHHGRWPHGSDWLSEVAVHCYLPLLGAVERLHRDGIPVNLTLDLSPVLVEQLASAAFQLEVDAYLRARLERCAEDRRAFAAEGRDELAALAAWWEAWYRAAADDLDRLAGDLVGALRRLEAAGAVQLITCAATHGYLPLLLRDESVLLQVGQACASHRRAFGRDPEGIWLPECAYRPRYEWTPPVGPRSGRVRYRRAGLEEVLARSGIHFFYTDAHLLGGGPAPSPYRDVYPALRGIGEAAASPGLRARTPYRTYRVASRGGRGEAAALVRDPETTAQVWSRDRGYPGDGAYLEFHKQRFPGGVRYWRVTSPRTDLGAKQAYEPARAGERAAAHAEHFVGLLGRIIAREAAPLVCAPYDTELLGHWWFEGPQWLEDVLRRLPDAGIDAVTGGEALARVPPREALTLLEGSWGEGGDHRVWLNRDTEWTWEHVYAAEEAFWDAVSGVAWEAHPLARRVVAQAARELLLLQASDWQFLITTWSARDYAEQRLTGHHAELGWLLEALHRVAGGGALHGDEEARLAELEARDALFPDVADHLRSALREARA